MSDMEAVLAGCNKAAEALIHAFGGLTLTDRLHDLAQARQQLDVLRTHELRLHNIAVEETSYRLWMLAESQRRMQEQIIAKLEGDVRAAAAQAYIDTGNAKPADGVTIKVFTRLEYDQVAATNWCRGIMPGLLTLDTKRFERMAREDMLPGAPVEIVREPRATIASDLSQYLGE